MLLKFTQPHHFSPCGQLSALYETQPDLLLCLNVSMSHTKLPVHGLVKMGCLNPEKLY